MEAVHEGGLEVQAGADPVVQPDLDQPLGHGPTDQALGALAADAQLRGDLVLGPAPDLVKPPGAGSLVLQGGVGVGSAHRGL